jgi:trimeric autotransporter adhesin
LKVSVWPAGTTVQLFRSDGATPLTDSSADGVPDTGPLAVGESAVVVVRVTLPPNACDGGCPTGPFDVQTTATSVGSPAASNVTFQRLGAIVAPTVDVANSTVTANPAVNQDPVGASPTLTNTVAPGVSTVFPLFVRNEGGTADTYSLASSGTNAFAPTTALPPGWTVEFRTPVAGVCSATGGTAISTVGPVAAGAESLACAVVTPPVGSLAGSTDVYFQVRSTVSGASDVVFDRVTVSEVNALTIAPSHTGQVFPGGSVVYPYTLANSGNTSCGPTFTFTISESLAAQGWTYVLYNDVNGDGAIDAGDTVVPTTGLATTLAPGASTRLLVRVFAPAGAAAGSTDVVSIAASATCGTAVTPSNTATGTTTVVTGQVRLSKLQAIDRTCLAAFGTLTFTNTTQQAYPGDCVVYRVTATNEGLGTVSALTISDTLPVFTLFSSGPVCSAGTAAYTAPTFRCSAISLTPAASATMEFRVRVQQ